MEEKKTLLSRDYKEGDKHALLSEFLEIIAWDAQHDFPREFGGLYGYFNENLKDAFVVNYFWIDYEKDHGKIAQGYCRGKMQAQLDSIRNNVKAIGWLDQGVRLTKADDSQIDKRKRILDSFHPNKNLVVQIRDFFIDEMFVHKNEIIPENIFYYQTRFNSGGEGLERAKQSKVWLKTISKGYEEAKNMQGFVDPNANIMTRVLAVEGMKKLSAEAI